ncbi:MAG TPA: hypothetical protein VG963_04580, partial [Polyangiaceae bacterium]|nr:hypothetical protein [Polyangiaceae bacterium]
RSAALDQMFAQATELPDRLEQTDLFTLDSAELARHGVVAYAPGYPLWSDDAKKLRMVRVPRGSSIQLDKERQQFLIPSNTRFYKTFLKRVIDGEGRESYRKMETRLIVARPDDDTKDGLDRSTALFGTYAWNDDETEAVLVREPLRDGEPFVDHVVTYFLDEQKVEQLIEQGETDLTTILKDPKLSRHYAMPGSERCLHCHMGSPTQSFVLGFTPLQIRRRPQGEGGVSEPSAADELTQLERLMAYGVITGLSNPNEVTSLEDSQGARKPRNEHELVAQGYMLGNCSHCHNPRGFPSFAAPELRDVLDFLPGPTTTDGVAHGIFQFPLDQFSPRIHRGINQDIPIAYVSPSLYDLKSGYAENFKEGEGAGLRSEDWREGKFIACTDIGFAPLVAPWRSLIYRNVETPFSYSEDYAIFPHMPRDTAGYDCRARQLLGTWMVSIPATWKGANQPVIPGDVFNQDTFLSSFPGANYDPADVTDRAQPYVESKPGDPTFDARQSEAEERVAAFQESVRYQDCPDPTFDIVDPEVEAGHRVVPDGEPEWYPRPECRIPKLAIPERPHWFVADLTENPGDWQPRRGDWEDKLVKADVPKMSEVALTADQETAANDWRNVRLLTGVDAWSEAGAPTEADDGIHFTDDLRQFALQTPFPLGVWLDKAGCTFPGVAKASAYTGDKRPRWMDDNDEVKADPDAPIYTIAPGAQVFNTICSNCHGPKADARGRMADTIADLTGGNTRVANLADGIFGPVSDPGANRARVFGDVASGDVTADDWAARYLLWMGLGGTQRSIPRAVLTVVANTRVLGVLRPPAGIGEVGANMLAVAEFLCTDVLPFRPWGLGSAVGRGIPFDVRRGAVDNDYKVGGSQAFFALMYKNGDSEFWERTCTLNNAAPVRQVRFVFDKKEPRFELAMVDHYERDIDDTLVKDTNQNGSRKTQALPWLYQRQVYPSDIAIGDHRGRVQEVLDSKNLMPWCVLRPTTPDELAALVEEFHRERPSDPSDPPYCADELAGATPKTQAHAGPLFDVADARDWVRRGAMNAGLSVFAYLDALAKGQTPRPVEYDHCEELK